MREVGRVNILSQRWRDDDDEEEEKEKRRKGFFFGEGSISFTKWR